MATDNIISFYSKREVIIDIISTFISALLLNYIDILYPNSILVATILFITSLDISFNSSHGTLFSFYMFNILPKYILIIPLVDLLYKTITLNIDMYNSYKKIDRQITILSSTICLIVVYHLFM